MEGSERASGLCSGKNSELKAVVVIREAKFIKAKRRKMLRSVFFFTVFILVPFSIVVLRELLFMFIPW
jgi:hypothetical protein